MKAEADNGQGIDEGCQRLIVMASLICSIGLCSQETIAQRRTAERLENTEHKL